jgi:hypothetical protein
MSICFTKFLKDFKKTGKLYSYMIFSLTDKTDALYCFLTYPKAEGRPAAMRGIAALAPFIMVAVPCGRSGCRRAACPKAKRDQKRRQQREREKTLWGFMAMQWLFVL